MDIQNVKVKLLGNKENAKAQIDYFIIDTELHQRFEKMTIDEEKEEFDLSDHNMLTATFTVKTRTKTNSKIEHTQK